MLSIFGRVQKFVLWEMVKIVIEQNNHNRGLKIEGMIFDFNIENIDYSPLNPMLWALSRGDNSNEYPQHRGVWKRNNGFRIPSLTIVPMINAKI